MWCLIVTWESNTVNPVTKEDNNQYQEIKTM